MKLASRWMTKNFQGEKTMKWQNLIKNQSESKMGRPMSKGGIKKQEILSRENPFEIAEAIEKYGNAPKKTLSVIKSKIFELGEVELAIANSKPFSDEFTELKLRKSYLCQVIKNYGERYIKAKKLEG